MRTCVINFSKGGWYQRGQERLEESFKSHGYVGDFLFASDEADFSSPSHAEMPYAFKSYGFQKALTMGYDRLIWCDAAITLFNKDSLPKLHARLDECGHMIALNGWNTGTWCSDAALPLLGIEREQSFSIPHPMANVMGFDVNHEKAREFLRQYHEHAQDGSFKGAWRNANHEVSNDNRVLGHRHDQTAAGVIAWRLGIDLLKNWTSYGHQNANPEIVFIASCA